MKSTSAPSPDADEGRRVSAAAEVDRGQVDFVQVAEGLPQLAFIADAHGDFEYLNPAAVAWFGSTSAGAANLETTLHPGDRAAFAAAWQQPRAGGAIDMTLRLRERRGPVDSGRNPRAHDEDAAYRWFQLQSTALRTAGSRGGWRWAGLFIDIDEPMPARARTADADRRNDVFLATLAHELRNPLAPIRTAAQVLRGPGTSATQLAWAADVISRQVTAMGLLLDDLLEVSRMTLGTMRLNKERVALRGVIDAALELVRPAIDQRQHELTVSGDALELSLDADPLRLTQVLGNLLDNAARYTAPGGRIQLSAELHGDRLELCVHDNGIGLVAADVERVFDMFARVRAAPAPAPVGGPPQASAARANSEGGLGLGLALVKGLVQLHGGSVDARSPGLDGGSVFCVTLPLDHSAAAPAMAKVSARPGASTGPLCVLVVDDNHDGADTMAALLTQAGHRVDVAYDGQQALRIAGERHPDVALIDIGMPRIDGCEVARRLRLEPWGQQLYLIAATGWGQAEDQQRTAASGFDRHLVKPVDPDQIVQMLADRGLRSRTSAGVARRQPPQPAAGTRPG